MVVRPMRALSTFTCKDVITPPGRIPEYRDNFYPLRLSLNRWRNRNLMDN